MGAGRHTIRPHSLPRLAAERLVEIVGEQARRLPARYRADHPEVGWRDLIGMRGRIAHGYEQEIDEDLLWDALTEDLPKIRRDLGI